MTGEQNYNLQPGTVIAGRFEVNRSLGSGSMGMVYACRDREFEGRYVAVKVLFPEVAADEVSVARFRNEIVASYRVSHPNVIRSYELVRDNDLIAYTMEYVEGGVLIDYIHPNNLLEVNEAIRIIIEMCAGVQAIHDAGIVHRDLKPENILLTTDGAVKIADFGIARTTQGPRLTEHGGVVGTIDYVSPEYILESKVDWRSDIYALGVLSYELITGRPPFDGDSPYSIMTKRLNETPADPRTFRPDSSVELDQAIMKALAREVEDRYQSAAAFAADLAEIYSASSSEPLKTTTVNLIADPKSDFEGPKLDNETVQALPQAAFTNSVDLGERKEPPPTMHAPLNAAEHSISFDPVQDDTTEGNPNTAKTETIGTEIIDIAAYYQNDEFSQNQLESVLSPDHTNEVKAEALVVNTTSIDKMKLAGIGKESLSLNHRKVLFALFVAIAIFVGVLSGFFLVDLMFGETAVEDFLNSFLT